MLGKLSNFTCVPVKVLQKMYKSWNSHFYLYRKLDVQQTASKAISLLKSWIPEGYNNSLTKNFILQALNLLTSRC